MLVRGCASRGHVRLFVRIDSIPGWVDERHQLRLQGVFCTMDLPVTQRGDKRRVLALWAFVRWSQPWEEHTEPETGTSALISVARPQRRKFATVR